MFRKRCAVRIVRGLRQVEGCTFWSRVVRSGVRFHFQMRWWYTTRFETALAKSQFDKFLSHDDRLMKQLGTGMGMARHGAHLIEASTSAKS